MLKFKNITKHYQDQTVFENFTLEIPDCQITCLLGASGVGKTTLLKMISGLEPFQGQIENAPKKVSYIFQEDRLLPNLTVQENLRFVCPNISEERFTEVMTLLEIEDKAHRYPPQLSGGEAKRVSIARAFLYDGDVFLMDEPFSSLDLSLKLRLIESFSKIWSLNQKTVLLVTHDLDEALLLGHQIIILRQGTIANRFETHEGLPRNIKNNTALRSKIVEALLGED